MKKTFLILAIILTPILNNSCSEDDDNISEYQGTWKGTYTGNENSDNGTWEVIISSDNSLNGTFTSSQLPDYSVELIGNVDSNGILKATFENFYLSGEFTGEIENETASGIWSNDNDDELNGTWIGNKN